MENSMENVYTDVRVQRVDLRRTSQKKGILHTPTTHRLDITQNGDTEWLQTWVGFITQQLRHARNLVKVQEQRWHQETDFHLDVDNVRSIWCLCNRYANKQPCHRSSHAR